MVIILHNIINLHVYQVKGKCAGCYQPDGGERLGKLSLVVADPDGDYLRRLGNYLTVHHSGRFNVNLFSSPGELSIFLSSAGKHPDVLLYSDMFPRDALLSGKVHTRIQLSENNTASAAEGLYAIPKYRHTDQLVQNILHIYAERSSEAFTPDVKASAGIYAVHSASGGCGKTSIAVGLSMLAARRNLKPLYLNFENAPSTAFYFKGGAERSFSEVIYYLKEKGSNLAVKLEGACCFDPAGGVYYYLPPESACEFEELTEEDIDLFLKTVRSSSRFGIVFIDLPSGWSGRNKSILKSCDKVINVCLYGAFSFFKKAVMEGDPGVAVAEEGSGFSSKVFHVLNRYRENVPRGWGEKEDTGRFHAVMGESEKLDHNTGEKLLIDMDPSFSASLGKLFDCLAAPGGEGCELHGGDAFA